MLNENDIREVYGNFLANEAKKLKDGETKIFYPTAYQQITVRPVITAEGRIYDIASLSIMEAVMELA